MYVEGEVRDGCITGRTILVIETNCELNPASADYSHAELQRIVSRAREEWEKTFGPTDLVRLEQNKSRHGKRSATASRPASLLPAACEGTRHRHQPSSRFCVCRMFAGSSVLTAVH